MTHTRLVLALLALVLPVLGCGPRSSDPTLPGGPTASPAVPATSPPVSSPVSPVRPAEGPGAALDGLPVGVAPQIAFTRGDRLVRLDGTTVRLRLGGRHTTGFVRAGSGWLVADDVAFEGSIGLHRVDAEGRSRSLRCSAGAPAALPDGRSATVTFACPESGQRRPTVVQVGRERWRVPWEGIAAVAGAARSGVVLAGWVDRAVVVDGGVVPAGPQVLSDRERLERQVERALPPDLGLWPAAVAQEPGGAALAVVGERGSRWQAVVRVRADGTLERATEPRRTHRGGLTAYALEATPIT
ncbi:MAG: hypothetical protein CMH83_17255 [Nocardioides sp.]|nr:hypothetical protein [Nocardioides sp.]